MSDKSFLTKGPLALFFGGQEIVPYLSNESAENTNVPIFVLISIAVMVYSMLSIYKFFKFRKGVQYEQQLNQVVISGARNVYSLIIIFFEFVGFTFVMVVHIYFVKELDENRSTSHRPAMIMGFIMLFILLNHFILNHKLW